MEKRVSIGQSLAYISTSFEKILGVRETSELGGKISKSIIRLPNAGAPRKNSQLYVSNNSTLSVGREFNSAICALCRVNGILESFRDKQPLKKLL